jgi:hypothetical protein
MRAVAPTSTAQSNAGHRFVTSDMTGENSPSVMKIGAHKLQAPSRRSLKAAVAAAVIAPSTRAVSSEP